MLLKTFALTTLLATSTLFLTSSCNLKSYATNNCVSVDEDKIRYVNCALADIDANNYNQMIRKITNDEYESLSEDRKKEYDRNFLVFGKNATSGVQNGFGKYTGVEHRFIPAATQNIVKERLINGEVYTKDEYENGNSLFPINGVKSEEKNAFKEVLNNGWKFPLVEYSNGFTGFKSSDHHLYRDYANKHLIPHLNTNKSGYFPFSDCSYDDSHLYTTYIDFDIYVSGDGKVTNRDTGANEDITINVSNDDDLWLYIDDNLVIDNGGIHNESSATYNIAKNEVSYDGVYEPDADTIYNNITKQGLKEGKLKEGVHTVKIFYSHRYGWEPAFNFTTNAKFVAANVNYIDKESKKVIDSNVIAAHLGENFQVEEKSFEGYKLIEKPEVDTYTATNQIQDINLYYGKKHTLTMIYEDYYSNEKIAEDVVLSLFPGEHYDKNEKEIKDYKLYKSPENKEGEMPSKDEIIKYSYVYSNAKISANYIDKKTGKVLESDKKFGVENEKAEFENKQINGYRLVQSPTEDALKFSKKDKTVNYYYEKEYTLTLNYIDKATNQNLRTENKKLIEGEKVTLEDRQFDRYKLQESPNTSEFIMQNQNVTLNYYYAFQTKIIVKYIVKNSNEVLENFEEYRNEGETYKSSEKQFENYKLIEKPRKEENILTKEDLQITYYYRKLNFNLKLKMELKKAYINEHYYELEGKLDKIETQIREANSSSNVKVFYNLKVENNSERSGGATIRVNLPAGYVAIESSNYKINDDNTLTINLSDININETREIEIIIKKNEERDISETLTTIANIEMTTVEEVNLKDNEAKCELVIMPRTGAKKMAVHGLICMTLITLIVCLALKKDEKARKSEGD